MNKQLKADLMLLLVTAGWGVSFYLIDLSLEELSPLTLLAYRFVSSFIIVYAFFFKKVRKTNFATIKYALMASVFLSSAYALSVYGVMYTSLTNAGFLCALTVIFAPIFTMIFKKKIPSKKFFFVLAICVVGMGLLTLGDDLSFAIGDLYCVMCAATFSINLLIVETAVAKEEVDAFNLGVFLLGAVGLTMLILAFLFEQPALPKTPVVWGLGDFSLGDVHGCGDDCAVACSTVYDSEPRRTHLHTRASVCGGGCVSFCWRGSSASWVCGRNDDDSFDLYYGD